MIRTRWGRIINISSVTALVGNRGQVNYAAAKGALNAATKALSLEVATRGITVNAVAPGIIASDAGQTRFRRGRDSGSRTHEARRHGQGSGKPGGLPRLERGGVHHRTNHFQSTAG